MRGQPCGSTDPSQLQVVVKGPSLHSGAPRAFNLCSCNGRNEIRTFIPDIWLIRGTYIWLVEGGLTFAEYLLCSESRGHLQLKNGQGKTPAKTGDANVNPFSLQQIEWNV